MLLINLSDSTLDEAKIKFEGPLIKEFILKAFFQKICDWLDTIRTTSFFSSIKEIILVEKFHKKLFDIFKLSNYLKKLNLKKLYIFKCSLRFY